MMATCKECLHYEACGYYLPTDTDKDVWDLCARGLSDEIADIENRCATFEDKTKYVEQKTGRWLPQILLGERVWDCSGCKTLGSPHWKWCPVCGAKMDGDT